MSQNREPFRRWIHQNWSEHDQTQLTILWGMLVFPLIERSFTRNRKPSITKEELQYTFPEYFSTKDLDQKLEQYRKHDYIRITAEGKIVAGTKLFCAFHAKRMYDNLINQQKKIIP